MCVLVSLENSSGKHYFVYQITLRFQLPICSKTASLQSDPAVQAVIELGYLEKDVLDVATRIKEEYLFKKFKESNNQLRQQILCKICLDKDVAVEFLPCGHLVSCTDCALAMKDCPVCRKHVRGTVRAFIA